MEVDKFLSHSQYALPVGGVLILAVLVFTFGFKTVAEPTFDRSSGNEEKKKKQVKPKTKVLKPFIGQSMMTFGLMQLFISFVGEENCFCISWTQWRAQETKHSISIQTTSTQIPTTQGCCQKGIAQEDN